MPRVSRKQADLNREIIVDAATRLFRERGLHGTALASGTTGHATARSCHASRRPGIQGTESLGGL